MYSGGYGNYSAFMKCLICNQCSQLYLVNLNFWALPWPAESSHLISLLEYVFIAISPSPSK